MSRPGPCGFAGKKSPPSPLRSGVVFFSAKSCPSARRVQVRVLTKSHRRLQPRVTLKSITDMDTQKSRAPPARRKQQTGDHHSKE